MNHPRVYIVIINWNGLKDTSECLESLQKITYTNYHVVVVDNASVGDDVKILKEKFGDYIHIVENHRNVGFAEGSNVGIKYALNSDADYVLLLNNDTVVHPDFLGDLVKAAISDRDVGIAGAAMYYYDRPEEICNSAYFINYWAANMFSRTKDGVDLSEINATVQVDCVSGFCMLLSGNLLRNVGLLDARFFFGYDDVDICIRAGKHGFKVIFVPSAKVWHKISERLAFRDGKSTFHEIYAYSLVRSRFIVMRKHWGKPQFIVSTLLYIAFLPKLFVDYMLYYRQWSMLKGFLRGVFTSLRRQGL